MRAVDLTRQTVLRILDAATRVAGANGIDATNLADVAKAAGVPFGLLRYHFRSKEHLLIEAQRATFRAVHERFEARFAAGERGVGTAMEALDALWSSIFELHALAPFMLQTMSVAARDQALRARLNDFNAEVLARVELGLMRAFSHQLDRMALPPERLARAVRTGMYGLVVELASCRTDEERDAVAQTYEDVRGLLAQVVIDLPPQGVAH